MALAVKLILELRGEKDAVQEPAYTETIAEAAPQDTPEQPAPQDTAPEAPIQEAPAQEEPEEDAGAYQPDRILELQPQGGRRMAAADYLRGHPVQVDA